MTKLKEYKMFIDGEWVDSESKKKFETLKHFLKKFSQIFSHVYDNKASHPYVHNDSYDTLPQSRKVPLATLLWLSSTPYSLKSLLIF